jgi:mannose-6-phosphate isomerase class I
MSYIFPSFVIYFCAQGNATVINGISSESIKKGEVILIPAQMGEYSITGKCTLLEITAKV